MTKIISKKSAKDKNSDKVNGQTQQRATQFIPNGLEAEMSSLYSSIGNRALSRFIQAKLKINEPGDKYEREADAIAEMVMRMPEPKVSGISNEPAVEQRRCPECVGSEGVYPKYTEDTSIQYQPLATAITPIVQRQSELLDTEKEQMLQTKESTRQTSQVTPRIAAKIGALRGRGRPLPLPARAFFESQYGMDFSGVHVHTDSNAAEASRAVGARAFTVGSDVAFGAGEYAPDTNEGKRLLAHELTHVVQQRMQPLQGVIQRDPTTPDWQYEADRLTTEELDSEIQAMRAYLLSQAESSEASQQTEERLGIFEQTLIRRERRRTRFREAVGQAREAQRDRLETTAGEPLSTIDEYFRTRQSAEALFVLGFINGYITEIPPGELRDYENEMREHWPEFVGGYLLGLPVGLWHGLTGLVEGIWTLVQIGYRLSPAGITATLAEQAYEFASGPGAYIEQRRRQYEQLRAIAQALQEFGEEFRADPTIVMQLSSDLGLALGQELANRVTRDYLRQSPHDKGYLVGDIAGQILFEVLLEIILAVATEGIGNLLRGVAAVGQSARAGGRVANLIRRMLEASPALRRLLRALSGAEDISDVARVAGRGGEEVIEGAARATPPTGGNRPPLRVIEGDGQTTPRRTGHLRDVSAPREAPARTTPSTRPPEAAGQMRPVEVEQQLAPTGTEGGMIQVPRRGAQPTAVSEQPPPVATAGGRRGSGVLDGQQAGAGRGTTRTLEPTRPAPSVATPREPRTATVGRTRYPQRVHDYIEQINLRFPSLRDSGLRPRRRGPGRGMFEERVRTGGGDYSFEARLRDGRTVQIDDIGPNGIINEQKMRYPGEGETIRELTDEAALRTLEDQMVRQSEFIRENGLPDGIWETNNEQLFNLLVDIRHRFRVRNITPSLVE